MDETENYNLLPEYDDDNDELLDACDEPECEICNGSRFALDPDPS